MKLPRASMTTTLFVTLVFAVDFGIARDLLTHDRGDSLTLFCLGFLPMATLLVFGLYRLLRLGREAGAFTTGFLVVGVVSVGGYMATIEGMPAVTARLELLFEHLESRLAVVLPESWGEIGLSEWIALMPMLSLPPFLLALAGGWFARRCALDREAVHAKERRHRASRRPRFTLASASILVAVLAFDFGLIRYLAVTPSSHWHLLGVGFLPIANALVLGLPGLFRGRGRRGPFLVGFEVAGWLATMAYFAASVVDPRAMELRLQSFIEAVFAALDFALGGGRALRYLTSSVYASVGTEIVLVVAFFTLPPLLVALFGGAITRQLGRKSARAA
jgi:hypothetical protein